MLHWGNVKSFPAFVTSVQAKYTLFAADGIPIRAVCTVTLEEMPDEPIRQNPTSGALVVRRVHRMVTGDSLASSPTGSTATQLWRPLAAYNGIDDPMRLPVGGSLLLLLPSSEPRLG